MWADKGCCRVTSKHTGPPLATSSWISPQIRGCWLPWLAAGYVWIPGWKCIHDIWSSMFLEYLAVGTQIDLAAMILFEPQVPGSVLPAWGTHRTLNFLLYIWLKDKRRICRKEKPLPGFLHKWTSIFVLALPCYYFLFVCASLEGSSNCWFCCQYVQSGEIHLRIERQAKVLGLL
jgi:hypothetical protein